MQGSVYPSIGVARCLDFYAYHGVVKASVPLIGTGLCGIVHTDFREPSF
jgi:hypothetical protein